MIVTQNALGTVFILKVGNSTGSCFTLDYLDRQYLITAKHVIGNLKTDDHLEIFYNNSWHKFKIKLIGHHNHADISVLSLPERLTIESINYGLGGLVLSQDIFFLGFPYGFINNYGSENTNNFPIPYVKKGILSKIYSENESIILTLDGINNSGFSGGPVLFNKININTNIYTNQNTVCAVISGYLIDKSSISNGDQKTNLYSNNNSGLIISYSIKHAVDLIENNPNGLKIK